MDHRTIIEAVKKNHEEENVELNSVQNRLAEAWVSAMHNASLAAGAIAAGAMVLLSSGVQANQTVVAWGVALLLIEVILVIGFVFWDLGKATRSFDKIRKEKLLPTVKILSIWDEFQDGKKTEKEFVQVLNEQAKSVKKSVDRDRAELLGEKTTVRYFDIILIGVLLIGIFLIVFGLVFPDPHSENINPKFPNTGFDPNVAR